ncbi:translation elongation factor Ts, partial [candidate division TA06 bacterium]|nr:translation elongation factor Ts [candidate division TA06 bacterium]
MTVRVSLVKELRDRTGAGMMDCKNALLKTNGNVDTAIEHLRKQGIAKAERRVGKTTQEGLVEAYIHPGSKLGVLVEVNCETDFVARTEEFHKFVRDVAMQIAATDPIAISRDEVPEEIVEKERTIYRSQALSSGKPEKVVEKIVEGKMVKFYSEVCLKEQPFVKIPDVNVGNL